MKHIRQHPRINLRFENMHIMDEIEALAHVEGLDLQSWLRRKSFLALKYHRLKPVLIQELLETLICTRLMLQASVNETLYLECHNKARAKVSQLRLAHDLNHIR